MYSESQRGSLLKLSIDFSARRLATLQGSETCSGSAARLFGGQAAVFFFFARRDAMVNVGNGWVAGGYWDYSPHGYETWAIPSFPTCRALQ